MAVFDAILSVDRLTTEISTIFKINSQKFISTNELPEQSKKDIGLTGSNNSNINFFLHVCLDNIKNKAVQVPVRLQSLKLLSALVNDDTDCIVLNHLEIVTEHLIEASQETDIQIALHVGRVIEKISSHITRNNNADKIISFTVFWGIIFQPIILLAQREHMNLREVACDCLGTISNDIWVQLTVS